MSLLVLSPYQMHIGISLPRAGGFTGGTIKTSTADLTTFKHWEHNVKEIFYLASKTWLIWLLGMVEAEPAGGRAIHAIPFPHAFLEYIIIVRITRIIIIWITLSSSQTSVQANAGSASCILTHCNLIIVVFRREGWEENSNSKCNWTEEPITWRRDRLLFIGYV